MDFRILKILEILLCRHATLFILIISATSTQLVQAEPLELELDQRNSVFQPSFGLKNEPRPHFAGRIHNVTVNVGREAVLECPVNHLGHYKVGWLKAKDQTILALHHRVITHNNRFDVDHDENRIWKLKIRSVQESDAGCYMCQINTEVMKKQVGCIDVLIPPEIDDLKTSSDVHVNENDEALLECHANGHPKPDIKWLREDKANFTVYDRNNKRMIVSSYRGEKLRLKRVQRHQMGAYLCIASNSVPPSVSKRIRLNVNFSPEITVSDQLHGVGPGANVTVKCKVEAHPSAINYWKKDTKEMLMNGPKYEITEEVINDYELIMRLTIKNWQESDESHFTCISTNSLGKADGRIQAYTYIQKHNPEAVDYVDRDPLPTPEYYDSSKGQSSTRFSNNADDLTYHTDNEMKRQNYLSKSSSTENSDRNGKFAVNHHQQSKESYKGSSYFSNSAHSANKTITTSNQTLMLLLLLMMMATHSSFSSYIAMSSC
eukprot:10321.XXX_106056_119614_1 [CDS] Oithona nana genome sequencing.